MGIPQYFSASYAEARGKLLAAARAHGAFIEAHVNPNAKGAELALDIARFGDRDAESLLIVCSGTHGNEGFCGSFCQTAFIEEGVIDARRRTVAVLLVQCRQSDLPPSECHLKSPLIYVRDCAIIQTGGPTCRNI